MVLRLVDNMLVHICCSVDSHFFLQKLQELYPNEKLIGFFYDPNIHPYSEYQLRLLDVQRSCKMLGIELIEGEYDYLRWLDAVRGFEDEPEKGARCDLCFDKRLETTAKEAVKLGIKTITTTLLTSPKKSIEQLRAAGKMIENEYGVKFITPDFRKGGGTHQQFAMAKEEMLYHQDYCGCIYALTKQREQQKRLADELFSPITKQILPESIEERIELYKKRIKLEEKGIKYKIVRDKFLNYRLLRGYVEQNSKVVDSYILSYSILPKKFTKFKIISKIKDVYFTNRESIKILPIELLNELLKTNYNNIQDILYNPPTFEQEIDLRSKIINTFYSLSPIIILKDIDQNANYKLYLNAQTYEDTRESLVTFS
jgi:predicted adenine nucleotide alpha hydrolase (AANH) superfamily ATPase